MCYALQRLILVFALLMVGCGGTSAPSTTPPQPVIRLSELRPLQVTPVSSAVPLRVAVAAVISPRGTAESYQPLLDYLASKLDRPIELVQRRTYAEVNQLIRNGQVDFAFVCTSAYVEGHDQFGMQLLAAPQVDGQTVYHSVLIVPGDSSANGISDLRGKVFAFTDPMSLSGRMYPTWLVREFGIAPDQFFARTFFTYSHDDAIHAVADHLADGAMVDSLVYDFAVARNPDLARQTRLVLRSPPFGIPPIVVGPNIRPQVKATLQTLLLGMAQDKSQESLNALRAIGVDGFVTIADTDYTSVRELLGKLGQIEQTTGFAP